jgi:hypothetical protein
MCGEGAEQAAFQALLGSFTSKLTNPATSARELAVAVEAVGELTPATRRFFGERVRARLWPILRALLAIKTRGPGG